MYTVFYKGMTVQKTENAATLRDSIVTAMRFIAQFGDERAITITTPERTQLRYSEACEKAQSR